MNTPRPRLTLTTHHQVTAAVRAGGFTHVAAEAFAQPAPPLLEALQRGQDRKTRGAARRFVAEVRQAAAQARLRAEMDVFSGEPKAWLTHGPGRDRHDCRGWAVAIRPVADTPSAVNALQDPIFRQMLDSLQREVNAHPEIAEPFLQLPGVQDLFKAA